MEGKMQFPWFMFVLWEIIFAIGCVCAGMGIQKSFIDKKKDGSNQESNSSNKQ